MTTETKVGYEVQRDGGPNLPDEWFFWIADESKEVAEKRLSEMRSFWPNRSFRLVKITTTTEVLDL